MKFIKITTRHTREELDKVVDGLDKVYKKILIDLYSEFNHLEYNTKDGFVAMYASIDDRKLVKLFECFTKNSLDFSYEDITKNVLFGNIPRIDQEHEEPNLKCLIDEFVADNLDTNTVLDKISEMGFNSLTEQDLKVLEAH